MKLRAQKPKKHGIPTPRRLAMARTMTVGELSLRGSAPKNADLAGIASRVRASDGDRRAEGFRHGRALAWGFWLTRNPSADALLDP